MYTVGSVLCTFNKHRPRISSIATSSQELEPKWLQTHAHKHTHTYDGADGVVGVEVVHCVCAYTYTYMYIHIYTHTHTHAHTHTHTHAYTYTYMYIYIYIQSATPVEFHNRSLPFSVQMVSTTTVAVGRGATSKRRALAQMASTM